VPREPKNLYYYKKRSALSLRRPFGLLLLAVVMCGAAINLLLFKAGILSLTLRTAAAFVASYICFFIIIRLWLHWRAPGEVDAIENAKPQKQKRDKTKKSDGSWFDFPAFDSGHELLIILLVLFVFVILALAINYIAIEGGVILAEAVVEYALFAGLIKAFRPYSQDWYQHVFKRSIKPFLILLVIASLAMYGVASTCPEEHRLESIVKYCWLKKERKENTDAHN
jgi:amino acid permease